MEQQIIQEVEKSEVDTSFDLPVVAGAVASPRVHQGPGDSVCTSCEG